jgi:hypothetical protein
VSGDGRLLDVDRLHNALILKLEPTLDEDVGYGIQLLVDIAERSLSDSPLQHPTTAVQSIDRLHDILRQLASRPFPDGVYRDEERTTRLVVRTMRWPDYVHLAFNEIRLASAGSPPVARRLRRALDDLKEGALPDRVDVIETQLDLLVAGTEAALGDIRDVASALSGDGYGGGGSLEAVSTPLRAERSERRASGVARTNAGGRATENDDPYVRMLARVPVAFLARVGGADHRRERADPALSENRSERDRRRTYPEPRARHGRPGSMRFRCLAVGHRDAHTSSRGEEHPMTDTTIGGAPRGTSVERTTQSVTQQASEMKEKGERQLRAQIDERTTQAGQEMRSLAQALRRSGSELEGQSASASASRVASGAAERLERAGSYLESASGDALLRDAERFARRRPWLVAGAAAAVGFAASRLLKASSERRYTDNLEQAGTSWSPAGAR